MKAASINRKQVQKSASQGPSLFEVEYLRQMKEELETFLRSKNFPTIENIDIAFTGAGYRGHMKVSA
jgi:hypothetical protein